MEQVCAHHERLAEDIHEIKESQKRVEARLGTGDVSLATLALRVKFLEKCVYSAVALALLSLGGAILSIVLTKG